MKPNHKIIYLVPDDINSWLWCDDPAPAPSMVEDEAIKYIRADQADKEIEQLKKDKTELVEALKVLLDEIDHAYINNTPVLIWSGISDKYRAIVNKHEVKNEQ